MPVVPTPPPLKWLAETRGRVLSQLIRAEGVFEERMAECRRVAAGAGVTVERLTLDLAGLDRTISVYDPNLDSSKIAPINAWMGRYGRRGALSECIVEVVTQHAPGWVRTDAIEVAVTGEVWISFETLSERKRWRRNTLCARLKALVKDGILERLEGSMVGSNAPRHWRLRQVKTLTHRHLRVLNRANRASDSAYNPAYLGACESLDANPRSGGPTR